MDNLVFYTLILLLLWYFFFYVPAQKPHSSVPPPNQNSHSSSKNPISNTEVPKSPSLRPDEINCPGPEFPSNHSIPDPNLIRSLQVKIDELQKAQSKDQQELETTLDQLTKTIKNFSEELDKE